MTSRVLATTFIAGVLAAHIGVTDAQPAEKVVVDPGPRFILDEELTLALADQGVIRAGTIRLPADLFSVPPSDDPPEPVSIPIGGGRSVNLMEQKRRTTGDGKTYVIGVDQFNPHSRFVMLLQDNVLRRGEIRLPKEVINLTAPQPANGDLIFQMLVVDPSLLPEEREPVERELPRSDSGGGGDSDSGDETASSQLPESESSDSEEPPVAPLAALVEVKLMVVYTPAAKTASEIFWGEPITDTIDFYVFLANIGFENQAGVTLNLVHTQEVNYTETGDIVEDLDRLACPCDHKIDGVGSNHLNEVFDPWKVYEVDIVSLWIHMPSEAGIANIMSVVTADFAPLAVNVVHWEAATVGLSFDHEIGHNFGGRHDRAQDNTDGVPYNYNHGFVNLAEKKVTIMAYRSTCLSFGFACSRTSYWSDPSIVPVDTWGLAAGPYAADNAQALETSAPTVADFEQEHNLVGCCINTGTFWNKKWRPGPCP